MPQELLNSIRAVVFDFDDTLAETNIDFALMRRRLMDHIRKWNVDEDGMGDGLYILELIEYGAQWIDEDGGRRGRFRAEAEKIIEDVEMLSCAEAGLFPGTADALEQLRDGGFGVGIVTRNCRRGVTAITRRFDLHYDVLLTRDDVECVKPAPAHLQQALEELDVPPADALMAGNHVTDIEVGKAAGTLTCGVFADFDTRQQLRDAGADLCSPDVASLAKLLCKRHPLRQHRHE